MSSVWYSLSLDPTKQVRIDYLPRRKVISLYKNDVPYFYRYCSSYKYVGCGIDAAHSFMGWFIDDITRKSVVKKVKSVKALSHFVNFFDELVDTLTDILPAPYDYDNVRQNAYFTTPSMLKKGLKTLIKQELNPALIKNLKIYQNEDNHILAQKIIYHLENGSPVIALIANGVHWVTIVGISVAYGSENSKIDLDQTKVTYIDLTKRGSYTVPFLSLKLNGWENNTKQKWAIRVGYDSYHEGTILSLENEKPYLAKQLHAYKIQIITAKNEEAQTNGDVYITLVGNRWKSHTYQVKTLCKDFQRNSSTEVAILSQDYYGEIHQIIIEHKNSDTNNWFLNTVRVSHSHGNNNRYVFNVKKWVSNNQILIVDRSSHSSL
ncbi:MAG: hypothetical protein K0U38_01385 [Epsilonproteobacteria bacterium]|nr:hypothetical protein [Campylobacterota bacterium]